MDGVLEVVFGSLADADLVIAGVRELLFVSVLFISSFSAIRISSSPELPLLSAGDIFGVALITFMSIADLLLSFLLTKDPYKAPSPNGATEEDALSGSMIL